MEYSKKIHLVSNISPEHIFLILVSIYGLLFLIITPPFQVADEYSHFYRSFQVSCGIMKAERDENKEEVGGNLPKSLVITSEKVSTDIPFHPENKQKISNIFSVLDLPLNIKDKVFVSFSNTALYSPVPYMPQTVGLLFGKMLNLSPVLLMYLGRLFNLTFFAFLLYLAIKITPVHKWVFFLLALSPMSLFQAASLSADGFINSVSFLIIALFLSHSFGKREVVTRFDLFVIFLLSIALSLSKNVYIPIVFMALLIPAEKFNGKKRKITFCVILVLSTIMVAAIWLYFVKDIYVPHDNFEPGKQLVFILSNPLEYVEILTRTFIENHDSYIVSCIGDLGWMDTSLPKWHTISFLITVVIVSLLDKEKGVAIHLRDKMIVIITTARHDYISGCIHV